MLLELDIKNYALIDHLHINFADGFSVITGETGSGKSILLGALSLILGERADIKSIRNKEIKCIIEGVFLISNSELQHFFIENDIDFDKNTILRREINPQGKSRAFINDTPVSLSILKSLSEKLIDIHSQHATLLLNDKTFVFDIIDNQIEKQSLLIDYKDQYLKFKALSSQLEVLVGKEKQSTTDKNYLEFLLSEFENVNLEKAIEHNLESEFSLLSNAEDLKNSLFVCQEKLSDTSSGIISGLQHISVEFDKIKHFSNSYEELSERITSALIELQDIESDIERYNDNVEVDNQKLMQIENELSKINTLLKKHNVNTIEELITHKKELERKLEDIGSISDEVNAVQKEIQKFEIKLKSLAIDISSNRKKLIPNLEANAKSLLAKMKMANAQIKFNLTKTSELNRHGIDEIELLAKTNLGGDFEVLKKIASGGEASRIMLAIKSLQTQHKSLPTIIFDEIDTGVSGEVATNMGEIMQTLGERMQVMSITHLPQIASKGSAHFKVHKKEENKTTLTQIKLLSEEERIKEIAQMLSSNEITQASIDNAKELLRK